ncbi:hypothetical protein Vretifemale_16290 [Volvox reticuliferus]|uniref:Ankyrin repeat domain-containing protein n=2 Tax=Volvox reticuliferus TaxID=1737510 RepID=A0A8J4CTB0_9CHLO|nr:hypothetical protein Vretifemale_16290 [Volvox reticuliferus]
MHIVRFSKRAGASCYGASNRHINEKHIVLLRLGRALTLKIQSSNLLLSICISTGTRLSRVIASARPADNGDPAIMGTDPEGFDPVADTVGPGIYSGRVKRDADGNVIWGRQYENHNPAPGPVYAGGGYTEMAQAIHQGPDAVRRLLSGGADPNEIMTGGARPLHTCGMSKRGQLATQVLIEAGADVEALDTYGYTPLHRMASNNLVIGAEALLKAGADPNRETDKPYIGERPLQIAQFAGAREVEEVLIRYGAKA